jgi:hypothetical protein
MEKVARVQSEAEASVCCFIWEDGKGGTHMVSPDQGDALTMVKRFVRDFEDEFGEIPS